MYDGIPSNGTHLYYECVGSYCRVEKAVYEKSIATAYEKRECQNCSANDVYHAKVKKSMIREEPFVILKSIDKESAMIKVYSSRLYGNGAVEKDYVSSVFDFYLDGTRDGKEIAAEKGIFSFKIDKNRIELVGANDKEKLKNIARYDNILLGYVPPEFLRETHRKAVAEAFVSYNYGFIYNFLRGYTKGEKKFEDKFSEYNSNLNEDCGQKYLTEPEGTKTTFNKSGAFIYKDIPHSRCIEGRHIFWITPSEKRARIFSVIKKHLQFTKKFFLQKIIFQEI